MLRCALGIIVNISYSNQYGNFFLNQFPMKLLQCLLPAYPLYREASYPYKKIASIIHYCFQQEWGQVFPVQGHSLFHPHCLGSRSPGKGPIADLSRDP